MRALTVLLSSAQLLLISAWSPDALCQPCTSPALATAARVGNREVYKVYHPTMSLYAAADQLFVSPPAT